MSMQWIRRVVPATCLCLAFCGAFPSLALAGKAVQLRAGQVSAMTQNLYIGAEVLDIAGAPTVCDLMTAADAAVQQVLANDFAQRADALAASIAAGRPDVVGLQEVFQVIRSDLAGNPFAFDDYLVMLLDALNGQGVTYYAAGIRNSTPITVPADSGGDCAPDYLGTIVDRDVILCRDDVDCSAAASANYANNVGATTPAGDITIERGWVSVVASVKGRSYRVASTHLEVDGSEPFRAVQYAQAVELAATLDFMSADGLPQIVLGDFNSENSAGLTTCMVPPDPTIFPCPSAYQVMAAAGFQDTWLARGGRPDEGLTCCQDVDLRNAESMLTRRLDYVWVRGSTGHYGGPEVRGVRSEVLGDQQSDRTVPDGLWPSDHAGVVADMVLRTPR